MKEMFGAGTACVVCPVDRILYMDKVRDDHTLQVTVWIICTV